MPTMPVPQERRRSSRANQVSVVIGTLPLVFNSDQMASPSTAVGTTSAVIRKGPTAAVSMRFPLPAS